MFLQIVNPVYEDDSIELQDKITTGAANNNLNKSLVDKQQGLAGEDVVLDVEQPPVVSATARKVGSSSNGHALEPSDSEGNKGTEVCNKENTKQKSTFVNRSMV